MLFGMDAGIKYLRSDGNLSVFGFWLSARMVNRSVPRVRGTELVTVLGVLDWCMGKRKVRNHELERYSRGRLRMTLSKWVVNSLDEDYAFDFEVRPTEGFAAENGDEHGDMVLPSPFYIQLKASEEFDGSESVWHDFDVEYLVEDCLQASIPVVLVVCDRSREELYWRVLQNYCWDVLDESREGWREGDGQVRVRIDRDSLADALPLARLRGALREAEQRIGTRQRAASSRRGSLQYSARMRVASTAEVHKYKREMVEDAVSLANAGNIQQAKRKLLEICQMAEPGDATRDAYRHLLELRELDGMSTAFAKIRFAREGARLVAESDSDEHLEEFREYHEAAVEHLEEVFVGSRYEDSIGRPIRVLDLEPMRLLEGKGAELTARVQHGVDFTGLQAPAFAGKDEFELQKSGKSTDPRADSCAEREHEFDKDDLRGGSIAAVCANCGLSGETIQNWLSHEVPIVCDGCGAVVYEDAYKMEIPGEPGRLLCVDCRP